MSRKSPSNVIVTLRQGESQEKLLKRFVKKCKKTDIVKEYLGKTLYFKTKAEKRLEKILKNKWLKNKRKFTKKR